MVRYISVSFCSLQLNFQISSNVDTASQGRKERAAYPQNTLGSNQLDLVVGHGSLCITLAVRLEVSEVTDVAFAVGRCAVSFGERVD